MNDDLPTAQDAPITSEKEHIVTNTANHFVYDPSKKDSLAPIKVNPKPEPKLWWRGVLASFLTVMIVGTYFGLRLLDVSRVFVSSTRAEPVNLQKKITSNAISYEAADRINILLLGVGDSGHAGADLSDSIMVLSVDPHTHVAAMIGIPRDLYVKIPGHGYDKINAAHALGELDRKAGGPALAQTVVSNTLGIPIHYYIRTDFTGLKEAIDKLGGVSVDVPEALFDPEYPCTNNERLSCGFSIRAGTQILSGQVALQYVRCRKGSCGNDFGRARRQQQILLAMREKALSLGTLSSPQKVADLTAIIGSHIRTDISIDETKTLYGILKQVNVRDVETKVLDNSENNLVKTALIGGLSVVVPVAGQADFSSIQNYVRNLFYDSHIVSEAVPVSIVNATGSQSRTQSLCNYLKSFRYNIISCQLGSVRQAHSTISVVGQDQMPYTLQYLRKRFKVNAVETAASTTDSSKQVQLTIGADFSED